MDWTVVKVEDFQKWLSDVGMEFKQQEGLIALQKKEQLCIVNQFIEFLFIRAGLESDREHDRLADAGYRKDAELDQSGI